MTALRVNKLRKSFGDVDALRGVDFAIEVGEFFALLGGSAAGKTTTLRVIAGIESADEGAVIFNGQDMTHAPVRGRSMAMVFQTFALYPHLTIYENLAYPLREQGTDRQETARRVAETAEQLRISHVLTRKPATLSGGEQQRVAIGRALIRRPQLLLLDEPLTNLDAKLRHDTRAEFKRLHRELGMTILYATPDELEALSMGQRIAVLEQGRILQTGDVDSLYGAPGSTAVARMVGSPPINLVPATWAVSAGANVMRLPFVELPAPEHADSVGQLPQGTELWVGIRPQALRPVTDQGAESDFSATVRLLEPLGDTTILDLVAGGVPLRMTLPQAMATGYHVGDQMRLAFDTATAHVFSRETGTRLN